MVANVDPSVAGSQSIAASFRELRQESRSVVAIVNMLFSVIGVAVAVFVAGGAFLNDYGHVRARRRSHGARELVPGPHAPPPPPAAPAG